MNVVENGPYIGWDISTIAVNKKSLPKPQFLLHSSKYGRF